MRVLIRLGLLSLVVALLAACFNPAAPEMPADDADEPVDVLPAGGLIGRWDFAGNYDDASGSGVGISATAGTPEFTSDRDGNAGSALDFDDSGDQATIPNYPALNNTPDGITVSFWVTPPTADGRIISRRYGSSVSVWEIDVAFGDVRIGWGGFNKLSVDATTLDDPWNHVVLTIDTTTGDLVSLYVNGVLENWVQASSAIDANRDIQNVSSENDIRLGLTGLAGGVFQIDDVRIYNRAITESEVGILYNLAAGQ